MLLGVGFTSMGQDLNSYKYVLVPSKFDFLKESNQYQMNELAVFLFEKYGFKTYMANGEKPTDWAQESCNTLYADIIEGGGLFVTTLKVELKDCKNHLLFTSEEGNSKEKDFKKAYQEALRNAFKSIDKINYTYFENKQNKATSSLIQDTGVPSAEKDIEEIVIPAIPQKSEMKMDVVQPAVSTITNRKVYTNGNLEFYIVSSDYGFNLFKTQMEAPFAKLINTSREEYFIYSTISSNGIAFFDSSGNLNIEILNSKDNSTSIKTYKLQN
jgi:hypothetical protein